MTSNNPVSWAIEQLASEVEDRLTASRAEEVRDYLREDELGLAVEMLTYGLSGEEDLEPAQLSPHEVRAIVAFLRIFGDSYVNNHLDLDVMAPDHFICPVCGYPGLDSPPKSPGGGDSYEICPSCGFEFGFDDGSEGETYESYRAGWMSRGKRWWQADGPLPGWNPDEQLDNLRQPDRSILVYRLRTAGCVFAEEEALVILRAVSEGNDMDAIIARREAGEPLEHIVGYTEFSGLRIHLEAGVFIPRRQTWALVATAARRSGSTAVCLDLCCGSGALGAAFAAIFPDAEVHAADIDPVAVACARNNVEHVYQADLFDGLPEHLRGRIGVVMANVPYVPTGELDLMPAEAREYEPLATHDGGSDGHDLLRRLLADAPRWVKPGGLVVTEIAEGQVNTAHEVFANAGFEVEIVTTGAYDTTVAVGTAPY